jgi:TonB family protein
MRSPILACILCFPLLHASDTLAVESDWLSAPKPNFPPSALRKGTEGFVRLRLFFTHDGTVTSAKVLKSSGDSVLDETARTAVLRWKMRPSAIKPSDLTKGRVEEIEFRQEALMAAAYPLGVKAGFSTEQVWKPWISAPFPNYPMEARRLRHTGKTFLNASIGSDGRVVAVQVVKTSGYSELDEAATIAVRHWRAHKQYAGQNLQVPVTFTITSR